MSALLRPEPRLRIFVPHASDVLTDHLPHGDGLVAYEIVSRLAARGHEVHAVAPSVALRGRAPSTLRAYEIPMRRRSLSARARYMMAVRRLYERLARERPFDVIHQLNPVFAGISLAFAGDPTPVVLGAYVGEWPADAETTDLMGSIRVPFAPALRRAVATAQQRHASALVVATPAAESLIVERRRHAGKLVRIPHGIDPSIFRASDAFDEPRDPTILFLGGTERRKGIYTLLDAFALVRRAVPECRLVVGGAGGRLAAVRAYVADRPEAASVDFLGPVERRDVPALFRRATVFCAPSNGEPFGMSLLEAMASGKPVVVTDAGGPAHIVERGGGEKVPVGDAPALAAALVRVLESPARRREMGSFNRRLVERDYAWDRVIDRFEETYAAVAAGVRA